MENPENENARALISIAIFRTDNFARYSLSRVTHYFNSIRNLSTAQRPNFLEDESWAESADGQQNPQKCNDSLTCSTIYARRLELHGNDGGFRVRAVGPWTVVYLMASWRILGNNYKSKTKETLFYQNVLILYTFCSNQSSTITLHVILVPKLRFITQCEIAQICSTNKKNCLFYLKIVIYFVFFSSIYLIMNILIRNVAMVPHGPL